MIFLVVVLVLVLWIVVLGVIIGQTRLDPAQDAKILPELAETYRGEVRGTALHLRRPSLEVIFDRMWAGNVSFQAKPEGRFPGSLHVHSEGFTKLFGSEDIRIGDPEFDSLYVVRGHPSDFVRESLPADARALIRSLGRKGNLVLNVAPTLFQFRIQALESHTRAFLDGILGCGLQLAEMIPQVEGPAKIVILESSEQARETSCQVCGMPLLENLVTCVKCATLHHADSWEFNGRCTTFACGSIASRKAQVREKGA